MDDLTRKQLLLVTNWQRKYYPLSELVLDSLIGLSTWDTLGVLAAVRKGEIA